MTLGAGSEIGIVLHMIANYHILPDVR